MKRFFAYEEYGAHWTTMSQDLTNMCKGLHGWQEYERGVEALSKIVASKNNRESSSRKALSFSDLLIKARTLFPELSISTNIEIISQSSEFASTHCCLTTSAGTLQSMMTPKHMRMLRRPFFDFRKRYERSTKPRMIPRHDD